MSGLVQWEAWQNREVPPTESVASGVWSIPVPIPRSPLRYLNAYAIAVDGGIVLVDTGWPDHTAYSALERGLREIGFRVDDVRTLLVTHGHPDHYGLVGRIRDASNAPIAAHHHEADSLVDQSTRDPAALRESQREILVGSGMPRERVESVLRPVAHWVQYTHIATPDIRFADGEIVVPERSIRAVWTPGHTGGHTCFVLEEERLLISGDHLLPRISPNISVSRLNGDNPLAQYHDSLAKVAALDVEEVLPAHEYRFIGHRERAEALVDHHAERLREIRDAVPRGGATAWQIAKSLTWSRPFADLGYDQVGFVVGETLSHLIYLESVGQVTSQQGTPTRWLTASPGR